MKSRHVVLMGTLKAIGVAVVVLLQLYAVNKLL